MSGDEHMTNAALIVAAGRGNRMMRETPKQYLPLGGRMVLYHTIQAFLASDRIDALRVVIHHDDADLYVAAVEGIRDTRLLPPVPGGASRSASVKLGLEAYAALPPANVLIHDAARPFCTGDLIARVIDALADTDGAFAALPVVDALWKTDGYLATMSVPRDGLWRAQTPQAFRYDAILSAHRNLMSDVADDVEVARKASLTVQVVDGEESNFKITLPRDLQLAEQILARRQS